MELFWTRGYEAVGVRELLDAMGVCRQSLYDTWGDKRQLFLRAVERYTLQAEEAFRERLEGPGSPVGRLRELLSVKARDASSGDCRGCLAMNAIVEWGAEDEEVSAVLKAFLQRLEKRIADAVRRGQESGEIDGLAEPKTLAQFLLFVCLGYAGLGRLKLPTGMARSVLETALERSPRVKRPRSEAGDGLACYF